MENKYEYYKIETIKKSFTDVYIKVPTGRKIEFRDTVLVGRAAKKTINDYEWDDWGWENDVEINSIEKVTEEDAEIYSIYDATKE